MITLYGFGPAFGLPDPSAFVTKVEVQLKMAGLAYTTKPGDFKKAPKGKIPYIDDNGEIVPDSNFIRRYIEAKYGFDFDAGYSPAERATALAFERMCEDHLYWAVVDTRWMVKENFEAGPAVFFKSIPGLIRPLIVGMINRKVKRNLMGQGFGRHSRPEIEQLATADIDAMAAFLGDKPFLLGNTPCGADATVFAFLSSTLCPVFKSPLVGATARHANLVAYIERMKARYYPNGYV